MPSMKRRWKQLATEWLSLPPDALQDVSRVTCLNGNEVIVENIESLLRVSDTQVDIDVGHAVLHVHGESFVVTLASTTEVHLRGSVSSLSYSSRGASK
ncbi:YabP/YqfC family sporulation protein [Alicyclobacillus sp. SO9]|uniref:YabP/YqfC family sporulation protein n=1 Tax=Alicyclobacillus sp. SO9 TaxID=2665646 RepID=UPI0018E71BC2|nr:YabP/YqfC family sporulation protein [Alicyclobacillus sp. SO9]QQE77336.1 hypothetical protein GI364_15385 [Alicyclobacillus sp. SO9]